MAEMETSENDASQEMFEERMIKIEKDIEEEPVTSSLTQSLNKDEPLASIVTQPLSKAPPVKNPKPDELWISDAFKGYLSFLISKNFTSSAVIALATQVFSEASESLTSEFSEIIGLELRIAKWKKKVRCLLMARIKAENVDPEQLKGLKEIRKVLRKVDSGKSTSQRKLFQAPLDIFIPKTDEFKVIVQKALDSTGVNKLELQLITEFLNIHRRSDKTIMLQSIVSHFKIQKMRDLAATVCLKAVGYFPMASTDYVQKLDQVKLMVLQCLGVTKIKKKHAHDIGHVLLVNVCPKNKYQMEEFIARYFGDVPVLHEAASKVFLKLFETFPDRFSKTDNMMSNEIFKRMMQQIASVDLSRDQRTDIRKVLLQTKCPSQQEQIQEFMDKNFATSPLKQQVTQMFVKAFNEGF